jgi:hypothetical protein
MITHFATIMLYFMLYKLLLCIDKNDGIKICIAYFIAFGVVASY